MARATRRKPPKDREPRPAESMKRSRPRRRKGGDPRTLPGSQDLGDQREPQTTGGMVKGT